MRNSNVVRRRVHVPPFCDSRLFCCGVACKTVYPRIRYWFLPRWHNALIITAGLISPGRHEIRAMRALATVSLFMSKLLRINGSVYLTRLLYLLLEFIAEY